MNDIKILKTSILIILALSVIVFACKKSSNNNNNVVKNEVTMLFNGTNWNTMITSGSQTATALSVGAFTDAGMSAENFFIQFKKTAIVQGGSYSQDIIDNYQIQRNGISYTITSATFNITTLTSTRFEATFTMNLSGSASITQGFIAVNI